MTFLVIVEAIVQGSHESGQQHALVNLGTTEIPANLCVNLDMHLDDATCISGFDIPTSSPRRASAGEVEALSAKASSARRGEFGLHFPRYPQCPASLANGPNPVACDDGFAALPSAQSHEDHGPHYPVKSALETPSVAVD
ncbi:unnamed protein product [Phytophthora fragariaefolia]|uniref:Unnamed protein product n=1 Tax=Phytophthora fragariaefolia TaxID=1490495 RepID=A0A9W6YG18_9STRA|nr:unnamed protein product [Phytophthora fragariaefolia]